MGCFFGCFRVKDDDRLVQSRLVSLVPDPFPSKSREPVISRNRLSSLLLAEDGSLSNGKEASPAGTPDRKNGDRELKEEARFLKACGTLPQTPAEIRKASTKFQNDGDSQPSKFHSWLPNTSMEKLMLEKHPDQAVTPIKLGENLEQGSDSLLQTPISCVSHGQDAGTVGRSSNIGSGGSIVNSQASSTGSSSVTSGAFAANTPAARNRYVRFENEDDVDSFSSRSHSSEVGGQNLKYSQSAANHGQSKLSPYPTPLKLSDEMQTPGTVFPANVDGRNHRVRSQYVYSALNPVENLTHWKTLEEEEPCTPQMSESRVAVDQIASEDVRTGGPSVQKDLKVEASLSSWLKPPPTNQDGDNEYAKGQLGRTPGDRPIIGLVATHWNEDEVSRISPKYWDGNGIPNSTNKYKEDQKVSWHATPFEERLEKALSNETSTFRRKHGDGTTPVDFDETEESDTALSEMNCSSHGKPVVSF